MPLKADGARDPQKRWLAFPSPPHKKCGSSNEKRKLAKNAPGDVPGNRVAACSGVVARWLTDHRERLAADAAPAVTEALDIAGWDSYFIAAKVHRAQRGLDEA